MTGPVVVLMAAVMTLTALYCAGRLVVAPLRGRANQPGIDLLHVVMGLVMAAMLLGRLDHRWDLLWLVGFGGAGLWFARASVVHWPSASEWSARHHLQHGRPAWPWSSCWSGGSSSVAVADATPANLAMSGMTMSAGGGLSAGALPGAALVVVLAAGLLALATVDAVGLRRSAPQVRPG